MLIALINSDSTVTDTTVTYEIPNVIQLCFHPDMIQQLYGEFTLHPAAYDHRLVETFFQSPFALLDFGSGQLSLVSRKGKDPRHTTLFLNGHRLDNPLFGYANLAQISPHVIDVIAVSDECLGSACVNLNSKVNTYAIPFSVVQFTWGDFDTHVYTIDFTRPITNEFGLYLNGSYVETEGYRTNSKYDLGSLYANFYYNTIVPMRFDVVYSTTDYGIPGSVLNSLEAQGTNQLTDICLVLGNDNHHAALYYTVNSIEQMNIVADTSFENIVRNYGIDINNKSNIYGYELNYRLMGALSDVTSDLIGEHTIRSLNGRIALRKTYERLGASVGARAELNNENEFLHAPYANVGFSFSESTRISATVSRDFRSPSLLELYGPANLSHLYYWTHGNSELVSEYHRSQELSFHYGTSFVTFYKQDYEDFIVAQPDSGNYITSQNVDSWQKTGVEGHAAVTLQLAHDTSNQSSTAISTGLSGNYLFSGYSLQFIPRSNARAFVTFERKTPRFGVGLTLRGEYVGERQDRVGQVHGDNVALLSFIGTLRFVTLSFIFRVDNVLDETYAYINGYENAPRNGRFSIKWEFWD